MILWCTRYSQHCYKRFLAAFNFSQSLIQWVWTHWIKDWLKLKAERALYIKIGFIESNAFLMSLATGAPLTFRLLVCSKISAVNCTYSVKNGSIFNVRVLIMMYDAWQNFLKSCCNYSWSKFSININQRNSSPFKKIFAYLFVSFLWTW